MMFKFRTMGRTAWHHSEDDVMAVRSGFPFISIPASSDFPREYKKLQPRCINLLRRGHKASLVNTKCLRTETNTHASSVITLHRERSNTHI